MLAQYLCLLCCGHQSVVASHYAFWPIVRHCHADRSVAGHHQWWADMVDGKAYMVVEVLLIVASLLPFLAESLWLSGHRLSLNQSAWFFLWPVLVLVPDISSSTAMPVVIVFGDWHRSDVVAWHLCVFVCALLSGSVFGCTVGATNYYPDLDFLCVQLVLVWLQSRWIARTVMLLSLSLFVCVCVLSSWLKRCLHTLTHWPSWVAAVATTTARLYGEFSALFISQLQDR